MSAADAGRHDDEHGEAPVTASPKERLEFQFDDSASVVRNRAYRFEQEYGGLAVQKGVSFFHRRPVMFTFLATFAFFSLLPLLGFTIVLVSAASAIIFLGSFGIFLALLCSGIGLFSVLLLVLAITLFISVFVTGFVIALYFSVLQVRKFRSRFSRTSQPSTGTSPTPEAEMLDSTPSSTAQKCIEAEPAEGEVVVKQEAPGPDVPMETLVENPTHLPAEQSTGVEKMPVL
ncbi:hypothetical protein FISHEDRAFT_72494 [Fistulina hepatica ATCC 64428]|uniref:Uncharacterized protein n=1 Tax=Fistulina hepatica ATCC 64428 TaxID=1128425 RepID=A0A0D7AHS3_9AGAR|nr:hypothetical protein FISHEDRAFT_72494 [Fistulina hepatica ATCC 64428]